MATIPMIGNVTVGGAKKNVAIEYVNINGVWKAFAKTYTNINGVWKNAWKELYTWKKYTVKTVTVYAQSKSDLNTVSKQNINTTIQYASKYTFNTSTGVYTLTSPTAGTISSLTSTKKYYITGSSTSGTIMNEFYSLGTVAGSLATFKYYKYTSTTSEVESQGTYISDVTSKNSSAYPTNGKHTDGYWYVKQ